MTPGTLSGRMIAMFERVRHRVFRETREHNEGPETGARADRLLLLGLVLAALVLRIVHLVTVAGSPYLVHLSLDPLAYDEWGRRIASGDWLGSSVFYQDPLYPYFLGIVYALFGHSTLTALAIQILLGALVPALTFSAARAWLGRPAAFLAGALAALYAPAIYYDALLLKTWMEAFLLAAALAALSRALVPGSDRGFALCGFLLGLGCLARANLLLLLPALAVWILVDPSAVRAPKLRKALALLAGAAIVLGAVALRNRVAGGEWVLTTSQAGQNFYLGNNPLNRSGEYEPLPFVGASPKHEEKDFAREAERRLGRDLGPSEISRYWFSEAFAWIRAHPVDWLRLLTRKFRLFWGAYEVPDNLDYYATMESAPLLRLPLPGFGLVAPLGLVGAFLLIRRGGWPRALLIVLAVYSASVILFYVFARYRIALLPVLFPLAGFCLVDLARRVRAGGALVPALGLLLALAVVNLPLRAPADSWSYRFASALHLPARAASTATAHFNLGVTYAQEAQSAADPGPLLGLAESELREALRQETRYAKVYVELGKVLARTGREREAIVLYRDALRVEPGLWKVQHSLGILHRRVGEAGEAERSFRRAMELEPRQADSPQALGELLLEEGRRDEAEELLRRARSLRGM